MPSKTKAGNRHSPPDPSTRRALAEAFSWYEAGQLAEAASLCRQVLRRTPENDEALHLLGLLAHQQGKYREAARLIGKAAKLSPRNPHYQYNYGESCRMEGRFQQAEAAFRQALALAPQVADIHFNLGNTLLALDRAPEARSSLERAIALDPQDAEFRLALGLALEACGRPDDAVAAYGRAIALRDSFIDAYLNRGAALRDLGRLDEAIADFRRVLAVEPGSVQALMKLGVCLQDLGDVGEATACFEKVLATHPDHAKAHYNLAVSRARPASEATLCEIEELLAADGTTTQDRIDLAFAAAKICEELGQYDRAFAYYRAANDHASREKRWQRQPFERSVDACLEVFDAALFARHRGAGLPSEVPIFIVGMPRAGTTLVEQILASHPSVHGAGELPDINRLATVTLRQRTGVGYPAAVNELTPEAILGLAQEHLERLRGLAPEAARITDKMPDNFRYLGLIALMFPRARILHCRRHPMDTCVSCYTQNFAAGQEFSHRLEDLGMYYRAYLRLMAHWRQALPHDMLEVDYEALVADQHGETRRILAYCGLDWDDRCLTFFETRRRVATASFEQVRRPIYASSLGRWRKFERHLGPLKQALGEPITAQHS